MRASKPLALAGTVLFVLHAIALTAPFFAPYPFDEQYRDAAFRAPLASSGSSPEKGTICFFVRGYRYRFLGVVADRHLFGVRDGGDIFLLGTDGLGRDQFSRLVEGSRISLAAGWLAVLLSISIGTVLGTIAGYFGGWVDDLIMRLGEASLSVPWLYVMLAARASLPLHLGPPTAYFVTIVAVGILGWAQPARLIRGVSSIVRQRGYVAAAKGFGAPDFYLIRVHVLPEVLSVAATQATVLMPRYILAELTLSFLGLGISEPLPSWGNLLAGVQQYSILISSWWMLLPLIAPIAATWCCLVISDALLLSRRTVPV
jgi:peptide/nickel transport system permease protein